MTFSKIKKLTVAFMAVTAFAAAQTPAAPAAPADTKKWKSPAEETLGIAANGEKDPAAQIEKPNGPPLVRFWHPKLRFFWSLLGWTV